MDRLKISLPNRRHKAFECQHVKNKRDPFHGPRVGMINGITMPDMKKAENVGESWYDRFLAVSCLFRWWIGGTWMMPMVMMQRGPPAIYFGNKSRVGCPKNTPLCTRIRWMRDCGVFRYVPGLFRWDFRGFVSSRWCAQLVGTRELFVVVEVFGWVSIFCLFHSVWD